MFGDEPSTISKLLVLFVEATRNDLANLAAACDRGDAPMVACLSHSVKGAAGAVGAEALRLEAETLEAAGRRGELEEAGVSVARLQTELEILSRVLTGRI